MLKVANHLGPLSHHAHKINNGDHLVHFYESLLTLTNSLCDYIVPNITRGDGIVLIATSKNKKSILAALERRSIDVSKSKAIGQLVVLDAEAVLSKFMVDGLPDKIKFEVVIGKILKEMKQRFPRVRAYGEMVNILWHEGNTEGTFELEKLWTTLSRTHDFSLMCGYSITEKAEICLCHTHVISHEGNLVPIDDH